MVLGARQPLLRILALSAVGACSHSASLGLCFFTRHMKLVIITTSQRSFIFLESNESFNKMAQTCASIRPLCHKSRMRKMQRVDWEDGYNFCFSLSYLTLDPGL